MAPASWIVGLLWRLGAIVVDLLASVALLFDVIWKAQADASPTYRRLRIVGHSLLLLGLALCLRQWGWDLGAIIWLACLIASTLLVALVLMPLSRWSLCVTPPAIALGLAVVGDLLI